MEMSLIVLGNEKKSSKLSKLLCVNGFGAHLTKENDIQTHLAHPNKKQYSVTLGPTSIENHDRLK